MCSLQNEVTPISFIDTDRLREIIYKKLDCLQKRSSVLSLDVKKRIVQATSSDESLIRNILHV